MKDRKAQAAMEFLLTYGWAILVVLIVISALAYFGVLNPRSLIPDSCRATGQILCQEASASTGTDEMVVQLINNAGARIELSSVTFKPAGNSDIQEEIDCTPADTSVPGGAMFTPVCTPSEPFEEGDVYSGDVVVQYLKTGGLERSVVVKVFQKVGPVTTP